MAHATEYVAYQLGRINRRSGGSSNCLRALETLKPPKPQLRLRLVLRNSALLKSGSGNGRRSSVSLNIEPYIIALSADLETNRSPAPFDKCEWNVLSPANRTIL